VDELEEKYADFPGLNLTFETREGILKHCSSKNALELGELGERFLKKQQPSLEAQLTNLADEIAYNSHDVDDGLRAELIHIDQLNEIPLFYQQYQEVKQRYPDLSQRRTIHEVVRRLINCQVVDLVQTSEQRLAQVCPADLESVRRQPQALITFSDSMRELNHDLKRFLRNHLYRHYRVHRMSAKAMRVIRDLFDAFFQDPRLMPEEAQLWAAELRDHAGTIGQARAVADYIAGMTDRYAITEHARVYNPEKLT
jgi:dGTPase